MKFSDLDLDIPSLESNKIKKDIIRASVLTERNEYQIHPAGVYFYKSIPNYNGIGLIDYKGMEELDYQKIDILNNTFLDNIDISEFDTYIDKIENEDIDWKLLWEYENPYQLSKYPGILREFKVSSVLDVAIILAIIRPGSLSSYDKMKAYIHTDTLLKKKSEEHKKILKETYGIPIFAEQFKQLGVNDGKYRYKKPHSIGYAYVLLVNFLKNS